MRKYFLLVFVGFASVSTGAYALVGELTPVQSCATFGYTEGADCDLNGSFANVINNCYVALPNTSHTCVFKTCGGQCMCVNDNKCPGTGGDTEVTCSAAPTWGNSVVGKQTGSCKGTNGATLTVYRCTDGYYATLGGLAKEYSYTDITCTKCPQHADDNSLYALGVIPKYITTNGAGYNNGRACTIKANTDIPDVTGIFQYDSACTYNPLEILG